MSLADYAGLRNSIVSFSGDNDVVNLLDDFIGLCEADMYSFVDRMDRPIGLRLKAMEQLTTGSTSTANAFMAYPTGYLELRRLEIALTRGNVPLYYQSPANLITKANAGIPQYFTETSQFEFDRISDQAYTINIQYYGKLTALSASNTTNSILTNFPMVYLYGCLMHLYRWSRDTSEAEVYKGYFIDAINGANQTDQRSRRGPAPAMQMANRYAP